MRHSAKRIKEIFLYSVLIIAVFVFANNPTGKIIYAQEEIKYNVFNDIKDFNGTMRKKAYVSKDGHNIVLLTAVTHIEYMRDRYGLIVWYQYKDKKFISKFCLIKNREEELFFTDNLDELLKELKKIPSGNKIYSYSRTCGGPKDVAYVGEDFKPKRIERRVYNAIQRTCKAVGSRFINYEFDKSEKRVICTCP